MVGTQEEKAVSGRQGVFREEKPFLVHSCHFSVFSPGIVMLVVITYNL